MKTSKTDTDRILGKERWFHSQQGAAAVEMALVLPLLLVVVMGLYEFSRAISVNNVITNISREGANLASRTASSSGDIIEALAQTASQADFHDHGTIYITRVLKTSFGQSGKDAQVLAQHRWVGAELENPPASKVWICEGNGSSSWDGDECDIKPALPSNNRSVNIDMLFENGEETVAVEVYYVYQPTFLFILKNELPLYSLTLL